jgi:predicted TPR repeat methyltransferase
MAETETADTPAAEALPTEADLTDEAALFARLAEIDESPADAAARARTLRATLDWAPETALGREIRRLRVGVILAGAELLDADGILREVAERRAGVLRDNYRPRRKA